MERFFFFFILILFIIAQPRNTAAENDDHDGDRFLNVYEAFFGTDPNNPDTDGDGFNDLGEIHNQYDPLKGNGARLPLKDTDGDEMWDYEEVLWNLDPQNPDTDGDGLKDKIEIIQGLNPKGEGKMEKWILIDLSDQTLSYGYGSRTFDTFLTSTGKPGYKTPIGEYAINGKQDKAWSRQYGLWMPYWMSFIGGAYGIHELPFWPNGYREGANHLGKPVSHGCVRLGIGPAKKLYEWAEVGTRVIVRE